MKSSPRNLAHHHSFTLLDVPGNDQYAVGALGARKGHPPANDGDHRSQDS